MSRFSQISINRALFATVDTRISAGIDQDFHEGEKQTDLILNMALKTVKTIKKSAVPFRNCGLSAVQPVLMTG